MYARIVGTGSYLPEKILTNAELATRIDTSDEWIATRTGIRARHIAADEQKTSDMALVAVERALEAAGTAREEIDLLIVATTTPDNIFPSTACLLQEKLGVHGFPAFDVQAVCAGFVYALATANAMIQSGVAKCAVVVGAEKLTNLIDWNDRTTCVLFGDGAGAVVLRASDEPGILATQLQADGRYSSILKADGRVKQGSIDGSPYIHMEGSAVFKFAVRALAEVAEKTIAAAGLQQSDVDWLVPHQANLRIIESTAKHLGLPMEQVIVTVDRHGNTSAASIPLALDAGVRDGRIKPGQTVLLEGIGGGFAWGSALFKL
ncbi:3-oxoacyl-[acyl-carrier-protein] synthase-3 [Andreprevotia lacus DSM 23236]|jgi:3-oxoacyl-[acyl-carrier-protein] synthase-3|uniref:Beta-ketoacyl-[acyl-carrier-protein] synthase III n=1 Tax=Andreprevotia lacus DSM 23236 TaxID=1121001 RepID=A0A1W1XZB1_9NEIS|nr:beta-ketoacyl-ACP synthase III [Andreprevotia lacus]SMC29215.1 3-oxoacyl-[acyl-carrier-protein] synthase-3 [Andreprevotia lacus DSM 23236]